MAQCVRQGGRRRRKGGRKVARKKEKLPELGDLKGPEYKYLGHFAKKEYREKGHNLDPFPEPYPPTKFGDMLSGMNTSKLQAVPLSSLPGGGMVLRGPSSLPPSFTGGRGPSLPSPDAFPSQGVRPSPAPIRPVVLPQVTPPGPSRVAKAPARPRGGGMRSRYRVR